ncbi:IS5 family transposase [Xenorhabdus nematophila]|uniref:IS5 family transposase n=7 Tax=Xenorhabdus nematophila TaxID=628 RepID=UPI00056ECFC6|nr:IS5 family transposase [Xenorhabdus nematophila]AYA42299.1 IS5 family transposase [Xenorhabdus nematophila]KHD29229.1 transposase [Xenorhabdus nematophila]QNJ36670.1 IS5 family transposase [Xenorhabdus nematophila]QNJ38335.1 IS5 family transposase [Xenorhabdus nematophila]QNJ38386.1 IS5 family transposase [Xenorhabdus nematophila]
MPRLMLTDDSWKLLSRIMHLTGRIYNKSEHRMTLEGMLFRMRTGIPWRDLPREFGDWNTVFRRFNLWSKKGVMTEIFQFLSRFNDPQWLFIDASIVKTHQDGACVKAPCEQAIGKSRGGNSTKIHLAVDSGGLPVHFDLSGGQLHDVSDAESLVLSSPEAEVVVADKGYDSQALRDLIKNRKARHVIPGKENSKQGNDDIDWCLYRYRHLVENAFLKIKKYRAVATRYDKLARNYESLVALAFSIMWLPMWVD